MTVRIYQPEGCTPYTRRVQLCNVETHIAANDHLSGEAEILKDFHDSEEVPNRIGDLVLVEQGTEGGHDWFKYSDIR